MSNKQSLKRIFSGANVKKYPTLGKFLPSLSQQTVVFDQDQELELLDQLVDQTLLKRTLETTEATESTVGRTKETARVTETTEINKTSEPAIETAVKNEPVAEYIANPELAELSQEIKEVSQEAKEQREQALIKEQQQAIDRLATEAVTPVAVSDKPVVVLPITAKSKEEAKFKSTKYSVRWLLEWCKKIAKMFSGAVVYKEEVDYE